MAALPKEVITLQTRMNRAMESLLITRSSLDACWRKQVSDFETALCQSQAEANEAIQKEKVHWGTAIREVETCYAPQLLWKWKLVNAATNIWEAESCCADQVYSIHQSHVSSMQHLEMEALEEEGRDHLCFLAASGAALQAYPPQACIGY